MKRITERSKSGDMLTVKCRNCEKTEIGSCEDCQNAIYHRLTDIEDILGDNYDLDRLRELVEADRDGRCVVLPCKVGDTIYKLFLGCSIKLKVERIVRWSNGCWKVNAHTDRKYTDWKGFEIDFSDFGKTVFLTREAAEAALKQKNE